MLQLLRRRWRRDALTPLEAEIAREHLPIPAHPIPVRRGGLFAVLRHRAAITTAAVVAGCGLLGGGVYAGTWYEDRREDVDLEARIDGAHSQLASERAALGSLITAELEERGVFPLEEPNLSNHLRATRENPPREPATLRAQERAEAADDALATLLSQRD